MLNVNHADDFESLQADWEDFETFCQIDAELEAELLDEQVARESMEDAYAEQGGRIPF